MNIKSCLLIASLAGVAPLLSGCDGMIDPFQRPGTWKSGGVNEANLRRMVAEPDDLEHGRGDWLSSGNTAVAAVERLRQGKVKALPDTSLSTIKVSGSGSSAGASAGGDTP